MPVSESPTVRAAVSAPAREAYTIPLDALVMSKVNEADTVDDEGSDLTWLVNVFVLMSRADPSVFVKVSLSLSVEPCFTTIGRGVDLYPSFVADITTCSPRVIVAF